MNETTGMPRHTTSPRAVPVIGELDPADTWSVAAVEKVTAAVGAGLQKVVVDRGELTLHLDRGSLLPAAQVLRDDLRCELLSSLSGVDYLGASTPGAEGPGASDPGAGERRLHAVYHLTSLTYRKRVRLEVAVSVESPAVPSVVGVWPTADWHERETWDFFGIVFEGHPALTRIQMPDDWEGHPQRRDYPLGGIPVVFQGAHIDPPEDRWAASSGSSR